MFHVWQKVVLSTLKGCFSSDKVVTLNGKDYLRRDRDAYRCIACHKRVASSAELQIAQNLMCNGIYFGKVKVNNELTNFIAPELVACGDDEYYIQLLWHIEIKGRWR